VRLRDSNTMEEKLITPILMDLDINGRKEVLGIHMYGDDKIELRKRCGDHYETLMDKNGNKK
jgi:hypothetical protein